MRIISKFHDYYDIGLSYGIDPKVIYKRKTKNIIIDPTFEKNEVTKQYDIAKKVFSEFGDINTLSCRVCFGNKETLEVDSYGCICFCGNIYPFVECKNYNSKKFEYLYSLSEVDKLVDGFNSKLIYNKYYKISNNFFSRNTRDTFKKFFNYSSKMSYDNLIDLHLYYDSPIFIYEKSNKFKIIINPKLQDFRFYKIYDSYTTFQNLSMFMSGVLGVKENEAISIADKDLKHMKGFNEESFRKEPTKKKN